MRSPRAPSLSLLIHSQTGINVILKWLAKKHLLPWILFVGLPCVFGLKESQVKEGVEWRWGDFGGKYRLFLLILGVWK